MAVAIAIRPCRRPCNAPNGANACHSAVGVGERGVSRNRYCGNQISVTTGQVVMRARRGRRVQQSDPALERARRLGLPQLGRCDARHADVSGRSGLGPRALRGHGRTHPANAGRHGELRTRSVRIALEELNRRSRSRTSLPIEVASSSFCRTRLGARPCGSAPRRGSSTTCRRRAEPADRRRGSR